MPGPEDGGREEKTGDAHFWASLSQARIDWTQTKSSCRTGWPRGSRNRLVETWWSSALDPGPSPACPLACPLNLHTMAEISWRAEAGRHK